MKKIKGYNIIKEKTNELLVSIEIGNDEVIERNGYKVIPFYEEGNPTIEQNAGENRIEGGVVSISGSVSEKHTCKECVGEIVFKGKKAYCKNRNCDLPACDNFKPKKESHYRPFNDCNELIEHYQKKYESAVGCDIYFPSLYKPNIWVKSKYCGDCQLLITGFTLDDEGIPNVWLTDSWITLEKLFDDLVFLDDSPCGVEE